jgi:hypothetical protein
MAYSPKYVSRDEIPVQVPDDYTDREKNAALEFAESSIALDLNDGNPLSDDLVTPLVQSAVKQKATCELVKGAEDPDSVKLGDLSDQGTTKTDYAQSFCDRYDEIVSKLLATEKFGESTSPYVYTTTAPE